MPSTATFASFDGDTPCDAPLTDEQRRDLEDELRRMQEAGALHEREWDEARATGLSFIPGCRCCGSNTPELVGRCSCQGIDLREP